MIYQLDNKENTKNYSISEATLSIIAIFLTVVDIFYRGSVLAFKKTISLLFQLFCIAILAAAIIIVYILVMTISTATGPWFNQHIQ